jgi:hypothetical protein
MFNLMETSRFTIALGVLVLLLIAAIETQLSCLCPDGSMQEVLQTEIIVANSELERTANVI